MNVLLFTSKLECKAGQGDGKGLDQRHWIPYVHNKHILSDFAELHDDV